jgi:hypothetical protein
LSEGNGVGELGGQTDLGERVSGDGVDRRRIGFRAMSLAQARQGDLIQDRADAAVGQSTFETVPDLDPDATIPNGIEQKHTEVLLLAADPPLLVERHGRTVDVSTFERCESDHGDLDAATLLQPAEAVLEPSPLGFREDASQVVDVARGIGEPNVRRVGGDTYGKHEEEKENPDPG